MPIEELATENERLRIEGVGQYRDRSGQRADDELDRRHEQVEDHDPDQHALDRALVVF
jgi:hypothetical protein